MGESGLRVGLALKGSRRRGLPMGQRLARHHMQVGVRLYHERRHSAAVTRWRRALQRLSNSEDRFITLGYLAQAFCDAGDYEAMLHYALQQMELATARNDDFMKAEGFLNLAKAHERLADFSKAIAYARASLQHPSMDPRTPGYAHLAIGLAQTGFSQFQAALEAFEAAMHVANDTSDKLLELQVCVGLGALFTILRDLSKALIFLRNALAILQSVTVDDVHAKYRCTILFHLSVALRIRGSLAEAKEACDEALRLSAETGNRALHARCLTSIADIYRELGESEAKETITKSWARYEEAFRVMRAANDRMGEVLVLASMAKSAGESRSHYTGQCECQAIQLNKKCLEIAKMIGCKHAMLKCHLRLADLYAQLQDDDSEEAARKAASGLTQEMQLFCNFCGQRFGLHDESLQALRCSHIFHEKCLHTFLVERADQTCPKCQCRAVIMDNVSLCTPSVTSDTPTTSVAPGPSAIHPPPPPPKPVVRPVGGVRTVLVSAVDEVGLNLRPQALLRGVDHSHNDTNHVEMRGEEPRQPLRKKPPPPPRKPNCMTAGGLPLAGVLSLPPPEPLNENGPLVMSRAPTITDV